MLKQTIIASLLTCTLASVAWSQETQNTDAAQSITAQDMASSDVAEEKSGVNINTASVDELASLNNIGLKKAQKIVEYRQLNGSFSTVDDLQLVKGIGKSIIEKNRNRLIVAN